MQFSMLRPLLQPNPPSPSSHRPPNRVPSGNWTRRVPHPVLIGHAASLTPY